MENEWMIFRLFTASLFTHAKEKASEASAKHAGVGLGVLLFSVPIPCPVKSSFLRLVLSRFPPRVQQRNKNTRK